MPTWYDDAFVILHYDHPYSLADTPPSLTGFDPDQVRRLLDRIRPDAVQYTAKGAHGFVPYDSRFGNSLPGVDSSFRPDILVQYRTITRELGIRFVVAYSGFIDYQAANLRPDWQRVNATGAPYPNRALCPHSGYVEELMLPQLEEILERCDPDGVWTDADNWTVSPCYCSGCEAEYQMLHSRSAPTDQRDPWWPEWLEFHRESFRRHLARVTRYLHERKDGIVYASSGAYATHQPELAHSGPQRLAWDLSAAYAVRQASLEARFMGSNSEPFDLMTWNRCSPRPQAGGRLPALPAYPKMFEHLAQEGAAILANGGRWCIGVNPYPDDALPEAEHTLVAEAVEWARARQSWCHDTDSGAYVAVLHSSTTHQKAGNGLYDPGPSLDRIRGAHQALLELHHPHDILSEQALPALLHCYQVLVLPEQVALPHSTDEQIEEWVRRGGRLIASGRVSPRIIEDLPTFALEPVLGVRWTGRHEETGYVLHRGAPMQLPGPIYHVALSDAEIAVPLLGSRHEARIEESGYPAVTRCRSGEGEAYYLAADFFAAYHRCQYPGLRELFGEIIERALPQPPLLTTAPATLEIALRSRTGQTLVHFVNHAAGKSLAQNSAFIEIVPPSPPFSVTLAVGGRPLEVRLQPEDREPEWSYSEGTLTVFVPPVHLHSVLVVTSTGAEESPDEATQ